MSKCHTIAGFFIFIRKVTISSKVIIFILYRQYLFIIMVCGWVLGIFQKIKEKKWAKVTPSHFFYFFLNCSFHLIVSHSYHKDNICDLFWYHSGPHIFLNIYKSTRRRAYVTPLHQYNYSVYKLVNLLSCDIYFRWSWILTYW